MTWSGACLKDPAAAFGCIVIVGLYAATAQADNCARSRDHILAGATEDLPRRPQSYLELYKICLGSLDLPNVRDAFILRAGAVAVLPRNDGIPATAGTLAQFCTQFPRQTLRFITRQEMHLVGNVARVVALSTTRSTPCQKIIGGG